MGAQTGRGIPERLLSGTDRLVQQAQEARRLDSETRIGLPLIVAELDLKDARRKLLDDLQFTDDDIV